MNKSRESDWPGREGPHGVNLDVDVVVDVDVDLVLASVRREANSSPTKCFGDVLAVNVRLAAFPSTSTSTSTSTLASVTIGAPNVLARLVHNLSDLRHCRDTSDCVGTLELPFPEA